MNKEIIAAAAMIAIGVVTGAILAGETIAPSRSRSELMDRIKVIGSGLMLITLVYFLSGCSPASGTPILDLPTYIKIDVQHEQTLKITVQPEANHGCTEVSYRLFGDDLWHKFSSTCEMIVDGPTHVELKGDIYFDYEVWTWRQWNEDEPLVPDPDIQFDESVPQDPPLFTPMVTIY